MLVTCRELESVLATWLSGQAGLVRDADVLLTCDYLHETRTPASDGTRLTDHSALTVRLALTVTTRVLTSDPATVATLAESEPTLF
ncbi:hypothetical protein [Actinokineospora terrae]|uniref:hypothetical protein n=1 Tax=Actinokineospora terrae TaxID=155974 RepID=UPI000B81BBBC|nr:hypothetical protein [Actinokineospora terrae]